MKQKSLSLSRNVPTATFGKMPIVFSAKVNVLFILYLIVLRLSSASDKAKLFAEIFSRTLILMLRLRL